MCIGIAGDCGTLARWSPDGCVSAAAIMRAEACTTDSASSLHEHVLEAVHLLVYHPGGMERNWFSGRDLTVRPRRSAEWLSQLRCMARLCSRVAAECGP